ncbi:hypothetical protein M8C21_005896 [Ambrosia artemisiifolia]|uniref:Uncharacterized protein n=1 Tax=Ambrosia artemisiifolia TaxID=4212 RepID=A0AAD5GLW7_AMBAR|nr:hypothetical protein M8C21_005896 [Ambrosia artemisiifolia]
MRANSVMGSGYLLQLILRDKKSNKEPTL